MCGRLVPFEYRVVVILVVRELCCRHVLSGRSQHLFILCVGIVCCSNGKRGVRSLLGWAVPVAARLNKLLELRGGLLRREHGTIVLHGLRRRDVPHGHRGSKFLGVHCLWGRDVFWVGSNELRCVHARSPLFLIAPYLSWLARV
jgi:hypothetical protein